MSILMTFKVLLSVLLFCLSLMFAAHSHAEANVSSANALGLVVIESPKVGNLLSLRGIAGKGHFLQMVTADTCSKSLIRLAAGDFRGSNISIKKSEPIHLVIYSEALMQKIRNGDEISSEEYLTSYVDEPHGDIAIIQGLEKSQSFILNPVEWSLFSLFSRKKEVPCLQK